MFSSQQLAVGRAASIGSAKSGPVGVVENLIPVGRNLRVVRQDHGMSALFTAQGLFLIWDTGLLGPWDYDLPAAILVGVGSLSRQVTYMGWHLRLSTGNCYRWNSLSASSP